MKAARGRKKKRVSDALDAAKTALVVQCLDEGGDWDTTLNALTPLWRWLFTTRDGLLQADGEGYYDRTGLVLEVRSRHIGLPGVIVAVLLAGTGLLGYAILSPPSLAGVGKAVQGSPSPRDGPA